MKEKELQNKVIEDIENNVFSQKIRYLHLNNANENNVYFSIHKIITDLHKSSVETIIKSLQNQDFDIINGKEIKNVAIGNDRLYVDVLIKGIENPKYYIIELKVNKDTGRETVTELMAYRHEIKNHLPFISDGDVTLIIISLEYSSLLKHAVSSLLLDNIPVLCLKPIILNEEIVSYNVEDILAWTDIEVKKINKKMFEGYSLHLLSKIDEEKIEKSVIDRERKFAIECYKADANMSNTNGICIIWDHYNSRPSINNISSDYAISIFKINPYCISYKNLVNESDVLSKYIVENIHKNDNLESSGLEIDQPSNKLHSILSKKYYPEYEGLATLYLYEEILLKSGKPIYYDAWGRLGQQIKNIYYEYSETLFKGKDYTEPTIFMKIFNYLFEEYPFYNGFENGEYFYFGIHIKRLENLLKKYSQKRGLMVWIEIERIWSILFCSFCKHPDLRRNMKFVEIEKDNINDISEYIRYFTNSNLNDKNKQAFIIGCQYSDYYLDSLEIITSCENEALRKLKKYFFDNFIELIDKIRKEQVFEDRILGCIGSILFYCSWGDCNGDKEIINTITKLELSKLKYESTNEFVVKHEIRNLLNYNT